MAFQIRLQLEKTRLFAGRAALFLMVCGLLLSLASAAPAYNNSLSFEGFGKFLLSYGPGIAYERALTRHVGLGLGTSIADAGTITYGDNRSRGFADLYLPIYAVGGFGERHRLACLAGAVL